MNTTHTLILTVLAALLLTLNLSAGTLDNAPFRFAPATKDWTINDAELRKVGPDTYIVATLSNTNLSVSVVMMKTEITGSQTNSFHEFYTGVRDSLAANHIKVLADEPTPFLSYKAQRLAYETVRPDAFNNYNETLLFATPTADWAICAIGLQNKTNDVHHTFQLFQKN